MTNTLFYGDNLLILREYVPDESVDLIYLDPPFNSNRSYNVLFKDERGAEADAQIEAFDDTWHWGASAEHTYKELVENSPERVSAMIGALRQFIGANQMMAYLVMMAARLVELHRVLKSSGSLYLHCDPTASHYLKILLDAIFDGTNFRNEIIWQRTSAHNDPKRYGRVHDVLLFYSKTDQYIWNEQHDPQDEKYFTAHDFKQGSDGRIYRYRDLTAAGEGSTDIGRYDWKGKRPPRGRHWAYNKANMEKLESEGRIEYSSTGMPRLKIYVDELEGKPLQDVWARPDLWLNSAAKERMDYPTQKPLALLERIINASSNEGDVVLDPFCGCGTAVAAAQKLNRKWIGIDITHLSIALQKNRLKDMFELKPGKDYQVIGEPQDLASAQQLAKDSRYQFQFWALSLVQARPLGGAEGSKQGKKGSDKGIDGVITFIDDPREKPKRALVQVKSGHVKSGDVRDLRGTIEREDAAIGIFITLEPATREMQKEAVAAGFYHSALVQRDFPKLQILTIEELLNDAEPKLPIVRGTFKQAERVKDASAKQKKMEL
ncbi:MAG: restriction endonuclease [Chloroflexi bacterium]|nr:restriction endonuclease [Chloroflexota bacterium]